MKLLLSLALFSLFGMMAADSPDEAFDELIDAFYSGDAEVVESHLSSGALEMIDMMLMMIKIQPDQFASEISGELQIALTGQELMNWTATDFIYAFINSPGMRDGLPPRAAVRVSGCDTQGDSGTVYLTVMDYPEAMEIAMVRENGCWKLGEALIDSEL